MASKRRLRRQTCGHKARHTSEENARKAVVGMRREGYALPDATYQMSIYRCKVCGFHHVGHQLREGIEKKNG